MAERKITAQIYPNTLRQKRALERLDGLLLEQSQCLVEQIGGKVRRLVLRLFNDQPVRARTAHPYGDAPITGVTIRRDGKEWNAELVFNVPAAECAERHLRTSGAGASATAVELQHASAESAAV